MNQKWSPLFIFLHCATFSERKNIFQKFKFFFQNNVLRFLSFRYSADFRRSRLACFDKDTKTLREVSLEESLQVTRERMKSRYQLTLFGVGNHVKQLSDRPFDTLCRFLSGRNEAL